MVAIISRPAAWLVGVCRRWPPFVVIFMRDEVNHGQRTQERLPNRTKKAGGPHSPALARVRPHFMAGRGGEPGRFRGLEKDGRDGAAAGHLAHISSDQLTSARIGSGTPRGGARDGDGAWAMGGRAGLPKRFAALCPAFAKATAGKQDAATERRDLHGLNNSRQIGTYGLNSSVLEWAQVYE